jgi:tRNA-2-methylthio-N6-dimethylallyladenosine synthase
MNHRDSEEVRRLLNNLGFCEATKFEDADIFVINSCSVRQAAEDSVYGWGRKIKIAKKKPFVILAGCLSGSAKGERKRMDEKQILEKAPWVDLIIAPDEISNLQPLILSVFKEDVLPCITENINTPFGFDKNRAYITISTGCDNFCSYCVVPYARKGEVAKSKDAILKEVCRAVLGGFSKITLLGQNVNSWGLSKDDKFKIRLGSKQKLPFANLIREICQIDKVAEIEFLSSNPFDFTSDLVEVIKHPKLSRNLHIAVQSGDNEILKKMNRRHTSGEFIKLANKIRKAVPDVNLSTDIIVGFPGETERQFRNTVELCRKVRFSMAFVSMYSARQGTVAFLMKDTVPLSTKKRRHSILLDVINREAQSYATKNCCDSGANMHRKDLFGHKSLQKI